MTTISDQPAFGDYDDDTLRDVIAQAQRQLAGTAVIPWKSPTRVVRAIYDIATAELDRRQQEHRR